MAHSCSGEGAEMAKVLSIEIGANVTRICLTDYKVKNPKVHKYAKFETPTGVFMDGQIQVTEELVNVLKNVIAANKMTCKQVVFPITSSRVASREVTIPLMKENKIEAMIKANASDYFPIDLTQYEIGYSILGKDTENNQYRVQVLAAPLSLLASYKQLANACGMQMIAADYSGNSIYQMVKGECAEGVKMVVKVDERATIVTVVKNEAIVLQRSVAYGVDEALQTIIENRVFEASTYEEALELAVRRTCMKLSINAKQLMEKEEDTNEDAALLAAKQEVAASMGLLLNGVARIIDYYSSRNNGDAIDKIYITGVGADFSGLSKLFANELGIKTVGLTHLEGQTLERSFKDGRFGEYIACVGAVINPVGFVSEKKEKTGGKSSSGSDMTVISYALLIGGTLLGAALVIVGAMNLMSEQKRYDNDVRRMNELAEINAIYAEYLAEVASYEDVKALYQMTENSNEKLVAFIEELEEKMPSNMKVTSFTSSADVVTMNMEVTTKEEMANAVQQLRTFDSLSDVSVSGAQDVIDEDGVRTVSFSLIGTYKTTEELNAEAAGTTETAAAN